MKTMKTMFSIASLAVALAAAPAMAQDFSKFHAGTVFTDFGKIADVDADFGPAKDTVFKVLFSGHDAAKPGDIDFMLDSAARFINMNVAAGVPLENIHVAIVLHGPSGWDVTKDDAYKAHHDGKANALRPRRRRAARQGRADLSLRPERDGHGHRQERPAPRRQARSVLHGRRRPAAAAGLCARPVTRTESMLKQGRHGLARHARGGL